MIDAKTAATYYEVVASFKKRWLARVVAALMRCDTRKCGYAVEPLLNGRFGVTREVWR